MLKTAVVILNWNGLEFLKKFLAGVISHTADEDTALFVADNGSTDGSAEWISVNHPGVKLIRMIKNHGFAEGYNLALAGIDAEYFVLLNSDIEVTAGWLRPLIAFLESNPDAASCQPKILSYQSRDHFEYAGAAGGFIDRLGYPLCRGRIFDRVEEDTGQYDDQEDIFWSSGACMAVRSEAWKKCGGFDAGFFAHMEEIDLCWRFHQAGYRVSYIPRSAVYHVGGGTLSYSSPFKTFLNFRNNLWLLYKNLPGDKLKSILFRRMILDGVAAMFFFLKGQFRSTAAVWKAHMWFYRNLSRLRQERIKTGRTAAPEKQPPVLNKNIVFEFYIRRIRTYRELIMK